MGSLSNSVSLRAMIHIAPNNNFKYILTQAYILNSHEKTPIHRDPCGSIFVFISIEKSSQGYWTPSMHCAILK